MQSNSLMQSQDMLQKSFFDQLRPGDFIDVKNTQGNWKLAKVIDKDNKYLSVIFDGYALDNEVILPIITASLHQSNACQTFTYDNCRLHRPLQEQLDHSNTHTRTKKPTISCINFNKCLIAPISIQSNSVPAWVAVYFNKFTINE